jgi:hypothetical protein
VCVCFVFSPVELDGCIDVLGVCVCHVVSPRWLYRCETYKCAIHYLIPTPPRYLPIIAKELDKKGFTLKKLDLSCHCIARKR